MQKLKDYLCKKLFSIKVRCRWLRRKWSVLKRNEKIFFRMVALILILWVGSCLIISGFFGLGADSGQFGDQFGAVNSLFSGLAFAGLIYTILLQRDELQAQREELGFTREEIKGQKLELQAQNETLALQRFENSFFSILSQHNEMVKSLYFSLPNNMKVGKSVIEYFVSNKDRSKDLSRLIAERIESNNAYDRDSIIEIFDEFYEGWYNRAPSFFGVYFRSLYRIFVFIDNSKISQKEVYADIVRSQLSDDELMMLFINGVSKKGKNFKKYIEKYSLLNNISLEKFADEVKGVYPLSAYGE